MRPAVADGPSMRVILGPCDDMRAEVFVRLARPDAAVSPLHLTGEIAGPECERSITLPAGAPLTDLGPGESGLLAKAVLTEPAFWTPELPNLYRLTARVLADGREVSAATRRIGLRRSGVRGRSLWLEGRRWVPRGVARDAASCGVKACRESGTAVVVADPPEPWLAAADEAGLAVVAVAEAGGGDPLDAEAAIERIAAWALHPSAVIAVLPESFHGIHVASVAAAGRRLKGTMLLAGTLPGDAPPPAGSTDGIDCMIVALADGALPHAAWRDAAPALPLVAWRRGAVPGGADRPDCDRLQAALAAWGLADGRARQPWDWAGYLVS